MIDLALANNIIITDQLDAAVQELDILFGTTQTELLGDVSFGSNFYTFLWELTPTTNSLKEYITNLISENTYYAKQFSPEVEVQYASVPGEESVYYTMITLTAPNDNKTNNKSYVRRVYTIR